jgi:heme-degrading monooxygenase HmoA
VGVETSSSPATTASTGARVLQRPPGWSSWTPDGLRTERTPSLARSTPVGGPARSVSRSPSAMMGAMTVVRINAITVPVSGGEERARRFAERAGAVDNADGFEGFELLRPTDDRLTWLMVTRCRDKDAFDPWVDAASRMDTRPHRNPPVPCALAPSHELYPTPRDRLAARCDRV